MANDLVPQPGRRPDPSNGHGSGNGSNGNGGGYPFVHAEGKVYDPLVPAEFVDTDPQTAGMEWDLPPRDDTWERRRRSRLRADARADQVDADAADARRRGHDEFADMRETDAAEQRQKPLDWGDFRTWAIIWAMFFGFLAYVLFVYYLPTGRHNQNDGPTPVPNIRVY